MTNVNSQLVVAAQEAANALASVYNAEVASGNHEHDDVEYLAETLDRLEAVLQQVSE